MPKNKMHSPSFWFPFGLFSLLFTFLVVMAVTFFINPANDAKVVEFMTYFWVMGVIALIFILYVNLYSDDIDRTPLIRREYNPVGMYVSFAFGLGVLALLKIFAPNLSTFSNVDIDFSLSR